MLKLNSFIHNGFYSKYILMHMFYAYKYKSITNEFYLAPFVLVILFVIKKKKKTQL
jgi:hypothetical protein